jgi:uncharacterized protein YndB with AHSA1/START domain
MPKNIDVVDETVIDSPPSVVFKAILNEFAGVTHWWMPYLESKLREGVPIDREGAIVDITVHRRGVTSKFSYKFAKLVEGKSIESEFTGDYVGTGKWTFEPTNGKTKVLYRWNGRPKRLLAVIASQFMDMGELHSDLIQKGFKALNNYLSRT